MRRGLLLLLALGAVACGSILGLGDYDIGGDLVDAGEASLDGGGPVTLDGGITISATTLAFPEGRMPALAAGLTDVLGSTKVEKHTITYRATEADAFVLDAMEVAPKEDKPAAEPA